MSTTRRSEEPVASADPVAGPTPWIVQTLDDRWTLLMPQQGLPGWWRQMGTHSERRHVIAFAKKQGYNVEVIDPQRPTRPAHSSGNLQKDQDGLTKLWRAMLAYLASNATDDGIVHFRGAKIARDLKRSDSAVLYAIKALDRLNFLRITEHPRQGSQGGGKIQLLGPRWQKSPSDGDKDKETSEIVKILSL